MYTHIFLLLRKSIKCLQNNNSIFCNSNFVDRKINLIDTLGCQKYKIPNSFESGGKNIQNIKEKRKFLSKTSF